MTEKETSSENVQFSPGSLLKQAREQKSLSIHEVSKQLKLTEQKVLQIEQDDYSDLPPAFYRGYLRNYAELVGLDENDIAENFNNYCKRNNVTTNTQTFKTIRVDKPSKAGKYIVKGISALLILALLYSVYYFVVEKKVWQKFSSSKPEAEQQNTLPVQPESELQENSQLPLSPSDADSENGLTIIPISESTDTDDEVELEAQNSLSEASNPEPLATGTPNINAELSLHFSDDCWVRIEDAHGKVLALGIKQAGSSLNLNGVAPYKLNLGKASAVNLTYENQTVDLTGYSDSRPARLTLGE